MCHIAVRDVLSWVICLVKFMFYFEKYLSSHFRSLALPLVSLV